MPIAPPMRGRLSGVCILSDAPLFPLFGAGHDAQDRDVERSAEAAFAARLFVAHTAQGQAPISKEWPFSEALPGDPCPPDERRPLAPPAGAAGVHPRTASSGASS
jgi:hypothetical protein